LSENAARDEGVEVALNLLGNASATAEDAKFDVLVVGLHFFNPAPLMRVVEIIPGVRTAEPIVATLTAFVRRLGHQPVIAQDTPGFVVNHAGRGLLTEALQVLDEGVATAADVDRIARDVLGLRMGPFELLDLTGLDVSHPVLESIWSGFYGDPRLRPSPTTRLRAQAGLLGRKSGAGFYRYPDGAQQDVAEPELPTYDDAPVWTDNAVLAGLLRESGVRLDDGSGPADSSVVLLTPFGESAAAAGRARDLPLSRVVGVDPLTEFARRLTVSIHPGVHPVAGRTAVAALAATGRAVTVVRDAPVSVAQRLLASIINTACEIAHRRIATPADIDTAVRLGLGYPRGPLEWGEAIGSARVQTILQTLYRDHGDPRYRPSRWLTDRVLISVPLTTSGTSPIDLHTAAVPEPDRGVVHA
jgi:3-hydroxybutyryl-CoA dehydrogenase